MDFYTMDFAINFFILVCSFSLNYALLSLFAVYGQVFSCMLFDKGEELKPYNFSAKATHLCRGIRKTHNLWMSGEKVFDDF